MRQEVFGSRDKILLRGGGVAPLPDLLANGEAVCM